MAGEDITSECYNSTTGNISIPYIRGNIIIQVEAAEMSTEPFITTIQFMNNSEFTNQQEINGWGMPGYFTFYSSGGSSSAKVFTTSGLRIYRSGTLRIQCADGYYVDSAVCGFTSSTYSNLSCSQMNVETTSTTVKTFTATDTHYSSVDLYNSSTSGSSTTSQVRMTSMTLTLKPI